MKDYQVESVALETPSSFVSAMMSYCLSQLSVVGMEL